MVSGATLLRNPSESMEWHQARLSELAAKIVAFAAGGFQIEGQIFHVQPQLAQGVLHQQTESAADADCCRSPESRNGSIAWRCSGGKAWMASARSRTSRGMSSVFGFQDVGLLAHGCLLQWCASGTSEKHAVCQKLPEQARMP